MSGIKIGDKVLYEGNLARVIDYGTMFIDDSWWIEYGGAKGDDHQMMVMGDDLEPVETEDAS
jgi:hypothetical protein